MEIMGVDAKTLLGIILLSGAALFAGYDVLKPLLASFLSKSPAKPVTNSITGIIEATDNNESLALFCIANNLTVDQSAKLYEYLNKKEML